MLHGDDATPAAEGLACNYCLRSGCKRHIVVCMADLGGFVTGLAGTRHCAENHVDGFCRSASRTKLSVHCTILVASVPLAVYLELEIWQGLDTSPDTSLLTSAVKESIEPDRVGSLLYIAILKEKVDVCLCH